MGRGLVTSKLRTGRAFEDRSQLFSVIGLQQRDSDLNSVTLGAPSCFNSSPKLGNKGLHQARPHSRGGLALGRSCSGVGHRERQLVQRVCTQPDPAGRTGVTKGGRGGAGEVATLELLAHVLLAMIQPWRKPRARRPVDDESTFCLQC